jgi:glutamate-1-semialdehyde 2,1-aminomutase
MPAILFEDDVDYARGSRFVLEALKRGVYLHPKHNMFLSLAHTAADIDLALSVTDEAFGVVAKLQ